MRNSTSANGPTTPPDWNAVNWRRANRTVRNLRQRIFRASQQGDLKKVRSLQKLLMRSRANALLSVRRVTQQNAGKHTPGVDKVLVKTPAARMALVAQVQNYQPWRAHPARRIYIPKATSGQLRPLGIPTILDRSVQALVKTALEPEWEARLEATSYGFRPGRSCHDAIAKIYHLACPHRRKPWVVDADIKGAFDHIDHAFLLETLGTCPGRALIKRWLKAGYMDQTIWHATTSGTPQGSVISPLLLNVALHGLETTLGVRRDKRQQVISKRAVVRYADDLVVFCPTQEDAEQVRNQILPAWLAQRGLSLSEEKTRVVHLSEGFDFLGFHVQQYKAPKTSRTGYKLLIRPSRRSVKAIRARLRKEWRSVAGQNVQAVLTRLNPIIRGEAEYFRRGVASQVFSKLDWWMSHRAYLYVRRMHPNKTWKWCKRRYWGQLHRHREDRWVFGDKQSGGYLLKFSWFPIERHILVQGTASPDDPQLREYWAQRTRKESQSLPARYQQVAWRQKGVCVVCGEPLVDEEVQEHHRKPRSAGGTQDPANRALVHFYCHQQIHSGHRVVKDAKGERLLL